MIVNIGVELHLYELSYELYVSVHKPNFYDYTRDINSYLHTISSSDKQYNYNIEYTHIHILLSTSILSQLDSIVIPKISCILIADLIIRVCCIDKRDLILPCFSREHKMNHRQKQTSICCCSCKEKIGLAEDHNSQVTI